MRSELNVHSGEWNLTEQLEGLFQGSWRNRDRRSQIREVANRIGDLVYKCHWAPEVGERVIEIGQTLGPLRAERLLENCYGLWGDPRFNFEEYADLFVQAHRRFGKLAGGYWSLSFAAILKHGVSPQDYFTLVDAAAEASCKGFAGWYAYSLPRILRAGGNPVEVRSYGIELYRKGGLMAAKAFFLGVGEMVESGSLDGFAEVAKRATNSFEKKTAYWLIRNMAMLNKSLGYSPEQLLEDAQEISSTRGEKAAYWYLLGLNKLLANLPFKRYREDPQGPVLTRWIVPEGTNYHVFQRNYLRVYDEVGRSASVFYALAFNIRNLDTIPVKLAELKSRVSKKVFSSAMWFGPKIVGDYLPADRFLDQVLSGYRNLGQDKVLKAISYTYGAVRRGGDPIHLMYPLPSEGMVAPEEPMSGEEWEQILEWKASRGFS